MALHGRTRHCRSSELWHYKPATHIGTQLLVQVSLIAMKLVPFLAFGTLVVLAFGLVTVLRCANMLPKQDVQSSINSVSTTVQNDHMTVAHAGGSALTDRRTSAHQVSEQPHRRRHLPHCVIIGSMKCGTSALIKYLDLHPDIVTVKNEIDFFNRHYDRGLEWYRKQMPPSRPNQITIEKTPQYFEHVDAPARIYAMNATVKIILVVRDPVDRSVSHWLHSCSHHAKSPAVCRTYEGSGILTPEGDVDPKSDFIIRSSFGHFIGNWTRMFNVGKQLHIVNGETLVSDPVSELKKVETFLGLRHHISQKNFVFSKKRGFYCMVSSRGPARCMGYDKGVKHPSLNPDVEKKLRDYFRPLNQRFYRAVGHNFGWR